jgi:hypothetical protein
MRQGFVPTFAGWVLIAVALLSLPRPHARPNTVDVVRNAHLATHEIFFPSHVFCSGTAIGKYVILTAAHCDTEDALDSVIFEGNNSVKVLGEVDDGSDHVIFFLDKPFHSWATLSGTPPALGQDVFIFGNPGDLQDVYRRGYISGTAKRPFSSNGPNEEAVEYDMNGFFGDSGAGVFDASTGQVIGVLKSMYSEEETGTAGFKLMFGTPLRFSPDILQLAVGFDPNDVRACPKIGP